MDDNPSPTGVQDVPESSMEEGCNKQPKVEDDQLISGCQTLDRPKTTHNEDPCLGMKFECYDDVCHFYKEYGKQKGFCVKVGSSSRLKDGRWRRILLNCSRSGKGSDDPCYQSRPCAKTGCLAKIIAKLWGDGLLHLEEVVNEHNHPLFPTSLWKEVQGSTYDNEVTKTDSQTTVEDPYVGMTFQTYDEVYCYYKEYAKRKGFGVKIGSSSKRKDGRCRRILLTCRKSSKGSTGPKYQLKPFAKTDCQAKIIVKLWGDGLLHLMKVVSEHNHPLGPSQDQSSMCNTGFAIAVKKRRNNKVEVETSNDVVGTNELERYNCLTKHCLQVAKLGASSEDRFQLVIDLLGEMERQLLNCTSHPISKQEVPNNSKKCAPSQVKRKGRPPIRKGSEVEN